MKQETVSGSGISWALCKSAPRSWQITMPAPHHSFLQAGCPSCHPNNSVKALKAKLHCSIEMKGLIHGSNSTAMLIAKLYLPIVFSCSKSSPKALFWNRWKMSHQQATGKSSYHGKWQPAIMGLFVCVTNYTQRAHFAKLR